jgi:hypothetical protein
MVRVLLEAPPGIWALFYHSVQKASDKLEANRSRAFREMEVSHQNRFLQPTLGSTL